MVFSFDEIEEHREDNKFKDKPYREIIKFKNGGVLYIEGEKAIKIHKQLCRNFSG